MPYGSSARRRPRFDITVATIGVASERVAVVRGRGRAIASIWSPSTTVAALVDRDHPIGVAVEGQADVGAGLEHRLHAGRGVVEPQPSLMLVPSGAALSTSTSAPSARSAVGRGPERGAVAAVDHHAQAGEVAALRASRRGRRRSRRAALAVLAGHPDAGADRAGLGHARPRASRSRARPRSRVGSVILRPPAASSFTPLSANGLWLAEITAPGAPAVGAPRRRRPAWGARPTCTTSAPSAQMPATSAASSIGPERRVSRPRRTGSSCPSTRTAARPRAVTSSTVSSSFATPRTPSVPKRSVMRDGIARRQPSALRVLRRLAGLLEAVLAPLLLPRVTREQAGLLEPGRSFLVETR